MNTIETKFMSTGQLNDRQQKALNEIAMREEVLSYHVYGCAVDVRTDCDRAKIDEDGAVVWASLS